MNRLLILVFVFSLISCNDDPEPFDANEQFELDLETIDNYLSDNNITAEIHESELRYVVNIEGSGAKPTRSSNITINYAGRLLDGTEFDSGQGVSFDLNRLILGWQIGVPLIGVGGSITLYIPSAYAYGSVGVPGVIPGNSPLIFDIDLISVQ